MKIGMKVLPGLVLALTLPSFSWSQDAAAQVDHKSLRATTAYELETVPGKGDGSRPELRVPVLETEKPWTKKELKNDPRNFQFAIVTDRTGGMRPGIFEDAVSKINLLQPEFVMCIGDLIDGYTDDENKVDEQWKEFEGLVDQLEMPFFYVGGNHDLTNDMMRDHWARRFGPSYYHFLYDDVLFLCLNSEDEQATKMSAKQIEYFRDVLEKHQDVRWTFVFVHKPLWRTGPYGQQLDRENDRHMVDLKNSRWNGMDELLQDRNHTVFSGHVHQYTQYERHGQKYFTLATTGGGSSMQGAVGYGRYDHIVWVTMGDEKPILANLELSGIYEDTFRNEEETLFVSEMQAEGVKASPVVVDSVPFDSAELKLRVRNPAKVPMEISFEMAHDAVNFESRDTSLVVEPNSEKDVTYTISAKQAKDIDQLNRIPVSWKATFKQDGRRDIIMSERTGVEYEMYTAVKPVAAAVKLDGDVSEWESLFGNPQRFRFVDGHRHAWRGMDDGSFQIAAQHSDEKVYFALKVRDNDIVPGPEKKDADFVVLRILPDGADKESDDAVLVVRGIPHESGTGTIQSNVDGVEAVVATTGDGYVMEVAVPAKVVTVADGPWKQFRVNVQINDEDDIEGNRSYRGFWKHRWDSSSDYPESGVFLRVN